MYVPVPFRITGQDDAVRLMREYPFATIVSIVEGNPRISYLPCVIVAQTPQLIVGAHFARANRHWKDVEACGATLLFHGPHGYISPRWYVEPPDNVPTWNYAVVHVSASARVTGDEETLQILQLLTEINEGDGEDAWSIDSANPKYIESQLKGIVGVHFTVDALDVKFKLSQNRAAEDRDGAIAGLRSTNRENDAALAELMERASVTA